MRVCFLIVDLGDGGAQRQCIYLLNELQGRPDLDLHLIHLHAGVHECLLVRGRLRVVQLPVTSNYDPRNVLRLRRTLHSIQPDVLLSWLHACDVYSFFARRCVPGMRWLMTERDSDYPPDPRYWLRRMLGRHADGIVANSTKGKAYWDRAGARCRRFVVPNIVRVVSQAMLPKCAVSALYVGRLYPQKNVVTVVRAFCTLATRRPDLAFSVIGDGSLRDELETIVRDAGLTDRIAFLGFQRDPIPHMAKAGIVVSMSHHEGLPNVLLESVALGTTIVASDIPEHRELLGPDYPFYVADLHNPEDCAAVMERALAPGASADALGFAMAWLAEMTPKAVGDRYMSIFQSMKATC